MICRTQAKKKKKKRGEDVWFLGVRTGHQGGKRKNKGRTREEQGKNKGREGGRGGKSLD